MRRNKTLDRSFPTWIKSRKSETIENLLKLRKALDQQVNVKKNDKNLIIASWNIKEFGQMLERTPESYFYIAEILNKFDLIAIQEIKNRLTDLLIIMRLLGDEWAYLVNDIAEGRDGNSERFAYIYDKRRVNFAGLAGEIVLWDELSSVSVIKQLKRTPYLTGFTAGWKSFAIINVHLNPGNSDSSKELRKREIRALAEAIRTKITKKRLWTENLMIMGDFNLFQTDEDLVTILEENGFFELATLKNQTTNISGTQGYDKIFYKRDKYFELANPAGGNGGVFRFFDYIYHEDTFAHYKELMKSHKDDPSTLVDDLAFKRYFTIYWRRNQMSDHYPIWLEMQIDSTDEFLLEKKSALEIGSE